MFVGNRIQKPTKTKLKRNEEGNTKEKEKKRHHDRTTYRLLKQEKKEYVI
jgi:hypothetical protein